MREIFKTSTPEEAVALSAKATYLQGGTEVLRLGSSFENDSIIDLNAFISRDVKKVGDKLVIGAGATFQSLIENDLVPAWLKDALRGMASYQLRSMATIGGNIALKRDDSFLIPALVAAGAELKAHSVENKEHTVAISEYIKGSCKCILLEVIIPLDAEVKCRRISLSSHMHAVLTAAVGTNGECYAIKGTGIVRDLENIEFTQDFYGSPEYKKYIAETIREELR